MNGTSEFFMWNFYPRHDYITERWNLFAFDGKKQVKKWISTTFHFSRTRRLNYWFYWLLVFCGKRVLERSRNHKSQLFASRTSAFANKRLQLLFFSPKKSGTHLLCTSSSAQSIKVFFLLSSKTNETDKSPKRNKRENSRRTNGWQACLLNCLRTRRVVMGGFCIFRLREQRFFSALAVTTFKSREARTSPQQWKVKTTSPSYHRWWSLLSSSLMTFGSHAHGSIGRASRQYRSANKRKTFVFSFHSRVSAARNWYSGSQKREKHTTKTSTTGE